MLIRHVSLVACLCWASLATYGDATSGAGYIFELPGPTIAGSHFQGFGYNANPFNPIFDNQGPTSANKIVPMPDGSKFYMLGAGGGGLQSFDPSFTTPKSINGILAGTACTIAITPNGKYLLIASALTCPSANNAGTTSSLYVLDTSNDTILPNTITLTGVVQAFAVSQDSKTAWILGNTTFGNLSSIIAMNMTNRTEIGIPYNLPFGGATSLTLSPMGLLYCTLGNRIYEIDPGTLQVTSTGEIPINALGPGPLRYTPDGQSAYLVNSSPQLGGVSILKINLVTHAVATWPLFNSGVTPPVFDDVYPVSNGEIFAFSSLNTTLWDITASPLSAAPSTVFGGTFPTTNVLSVAFSSELPAARYFYVLVGNGNQTSLYRMNLSNNTLDLQTLAILGPGVLQFVGVPPQTGTAAFIQYSTSQTVKAGATSGPLTVVATDGSGRPVYNVPITYATDPTNGVVINGAAQTTNSNGWATATATMPNLPGSYVISVSSGTATSTFTLTVPGSNGGGGGGGGGTTSQVSIVGGNGEFIQAFGRSPSYAPLTVQVTDTKGVPLANQPVTFSVVSGPGTIDTQGFTITTDVNGLAATDFAAQVPQQGVPYQSTDVNASTTFGGVDFTETTYVLNPDGTGQPQITLTAPPLDSGPIVAGEGDVVPNAIAASIFTAGAITGQVLPVPNVGIRIAAPDDYSQPGPAYCQGSTLSDNNGIAHCNMIATCQVGVTLPHVFGIAILIGEDQVTGAQVLLQPGSSRALSILAGNNQTGRGGQVLPIDLTALVNDNCATPIGGQAVTWAVTQGSATLSNIVSVSKSGGQVSAKVTLGSTPGPVQITVSMAGAQQVFNITNQVVVNSLTLVSGNNQTGFINNTVPQPLVFQIKDINNNPVVNAQVTFTVTGNGAVNPTTGTTDANGNVSTVITAGSTPSTVVVTANYAGFTASATATIKLPGPSLTPNSFQNAASFVTGLVPCGLATVIGPGLAPNVQGVVSGSALGFGPLQTSVAGVTISINGVPTPIFNVVNQNGTQQVTFQTPCETLGNSSATVIITVNGTSTTVTGVPTLVAQPGIFNGYVISAADGSLVTASNPAKRGGTYIMVATSLGQTSPPILTNSVGIANQNLVAQTVVGVANYGVPVNAVQYLQSQIGFYLVNFTIPTTVTQPGGTVPFPTGNNVPLSLGVIYNGQTLFSAPSSLAAVQ
jgi:uncharacterized protein (TIGR03437 family)